MRTLTLDELKTFSSDKGFIVSFGAPWCGPCSDLKANLEFLDSLLKGTIPVITLDIDGNPDAEKTYGFASIPATFLVEPNTNLSRDTKRIIGNNFSGIIRAIPSSGLILPEDLPETASKLFTSGLIIGDNNLPYGDLAQVGTFEGLACAPTSVTNALRALDLDGLLQPATSTLTSLEATQSRLGKEYFHTSWNWANYDASEFGPQTAVSKSLNPNLPDPNEDFSTGWQVAPGTPPSMVLKGTLDYIRSQGLADQITVSAAGVINGTLKSINNSINYNFAGFDIQANIDNALITSPDLQSFQENFTTFETGDSRGVLDFLMQGLLRGPVVFGMYYTNKAGGHAIAATDLLIDDRNSNGIIEFGEGVISFVDPLDPSSQYAPPIGSPITQDTYDNGYIESTGDLKIKTAFIWQNDDGFVDILYQQKSLERNKDDGTLSYIDGDSSNQTESDQTIAAVTMAMQLNTSGLAPDFDRLAGKHSLDIPGLIDFSFLLQDLKTSDKNLGGFAYSNESSSFANSFFYYECLDINGRIEVKDSITGATTTLLPGDVGYNQAAWNLAQEFSGPGGAIELGARQSSDTETLTSFQLDVSELNTGYLSPIAQTSQGDIWVPFASANIDQQQHFESTGPLSWRMEDLRGLGDRDFNDLHVSILIESIY